MLFIINNSNYFKFTEWINTKLFKKSEKEAMVLSLKFKDWIQKSMISKMGKKINYKPIQHTLAHQHKINPKPISNNKINNHHLNTFVGRKSTTVIYLKKSAVK